MNMSDGGLRCLNRGKGTIKTVWYIYANKPNEKFELSVRKTMTAIAMGAYLAAYKLAATIPSAIGLILDPLSRRSRKPKSTIKV